MRLTLGNASNNLKTTLARWGSEIRRAFFLADEDIESSEWNFDLTDLYTSTAGVTFTDLAVTGRNYVHYGNVCLWNVLLTIRASADYLDLFIPPPPPKPKTKGTSVSPQGGYITPVRLAAVFGNVSMNVPAVIGLNVSDRFQVSPTLRGSGIMMYTNGGTIKTTFNLGGFYFTESLPER